MGFLFYVFNEIMVGIEVFWYFYISITKNSSVLVTREEKWSKHKIRF